MNECLEEKNILEDRWTDNQKQAILRNNNNLLVSAGAGSRENCCFGRKNNK